ncbi:hypothetical protein BB561_000433 [Smittium simulii]|uniref:Spindle assembly checkpoint component MAD1 n=1 Tax=Smittium simulii TaxID=133385 RepID=A0A2T9YZ34_9FUNG|nr:hypothetical protein BB561_000433 [Smittium simulii]
MNTEKIPIGESAAAQTNTASKAFSNHIKETPIHSTRRNRLALEINSSRKQLNSNLYAPESRMLPPSTVIRNRFKEFLNGPARLSATVNKRRRALEDDFVSTPDNKNKGGEHKFGTGLSYSLSLRESSTKTSDRNSFFLEKSNIYETPSQNRVSSKNIFHSYNIQAQTDNIESIANQENQLESSENRFSCKNNELTQASRNSLAKTPNSNLSFDFLSTPINFQTPESNSQLSSIARPGSAVRKMLDESLKESHRLSELEKSKQEAEKAVYEQKKLSIELNRYKIEMERLEAEFQNKIILQEKKIESLEKERDFFFDKQTSANEMLKKTEHEYSGSKIQHSQIIKKLQNQLDEEEEFRTEQQRVSDNSANRLKTRILTLESRIVKLEKYRELMDKQMVDVIKEAQTDIPDSELEKYDWQKSIASIKSIIISKNQHIDELDNRILEYSKLLEFNVDNDDDTVSSSTHTNDSSASFNKNVIKKFSQEASSNNTAITSKNSELKISFDKNDIYGLKKNRTLKIQDLVNKTAALDRIIAANIAKLNDKQSENNQLKNKVNSLQSQIRDYNIIKEQNTELTCKISEMENLKQDFVKLETDYKSLLEEHDQWNSMIYQDNEVDSSNSSVTSNMILNLISKQKNDIKMLNMRVKDLEYENETLTAQLHHNDSLKVKCDLEIQELYTKLNSVSYKLARFEKSKNVAFKEIEFLKAQLKTYDLEEENLMEGNYDMAKSERIAQLENRLETQQEYINQLELISHKKSQNDTYNCNDEMPNAADDTHNIENKSSAMITRLLESNKEFEEKSKLLEQDIKKYQSLNEELVNEKNSIKVKYEEQERCLAKMEYMVGAGDYNPLTTRILQLAENPSSKDYAIRKADLNKIKEENRALLDQLQKLLQSGNPVDPNINPPQSSGNDIATIKRLKEVWRAKALELREAIYSLLGYRVDFLENGRVRLTSMYSASPNNSFIFGSSAGDKGTIELIGGGNKSYIQSLQTDIRYWVSERGSIPAFLATTTLQLFESKTA